MDTETNESDTYYTIKEASELLNIPASTLRYWEKQGILSIHLGCDGVEIRDKQGSL